VLKEKENLLESEIKKMETKLRRIEGLARSRSKYAGEEAGSYYDFTDMETELTKEFGTLKDENTSIKDKVRKLRVI